MALPDNPRWLHLNFHGPTLQRGPLPGADGQRVYDATFTLKFLAAALATYNADVRKLIQVLQTARTPMIVSERCDLCATGHTDGRGWLRCALHVAARRSASQECLRRNGRCL